MAISTTKIEKIGSVELEVVTGEKEEDQFSAGKLLKLAEQHSQKKGPEDLSEHHDKYLYEE